MKKNCFLILALFISVSGFSQITFDNSVTPNQMVQALVGPGYTYTNATLTCPSGAFGTFTGGSTTNLGIDQGIALTTGGTVIVSGSNSSDGAGFDNGAPGDADLTALIGIGTSNACKLEFDLVPMCDTLRFEYVFASENYPEWVCASTNDAFAFYISGPGITGTQNIAVVPVTLAPITINTLNPTIAQGCGTLSGTNACCGTNNSYYVDNTGGTTIQYDGFTVPMVAQRVVQHCQNYHIKIVIADGNETIFDSGVFLKKSTQTSCFGISVGAAGGSGNGIDAVEGCQNGSFQICLSEPQAAQYTFHFTHGGTAIMGTDYTSFPDSVVFAPGVSCMTVNVIPVADGSTESAETVTLHFASSTCSPGDSATINILDSYSANAGPDVSYCSGSTPVIGTDSVPGTIYTWSTSMGLTDSTIAQPYVNYINTGTAPYSVYFVLSSTIGSCSDTNGVLVTVNPMPPFPNAGADMTVCEGQTVQIGSPPEAGLTYSWTPTTGLSDSTVSDPFVTPTDTIAYFMMATNACGFTTDDILLFFSPLPIANAGTDVSICTSSSTTLNGSGGETYAWSPPATLDDPSVANPVATPIAANNIYSLIATNFCGSDTDSVSVTLETMLTVSAGTDVTVCQGKSTTLHATSTSSNYSWSPPADLTGANTANPVATPGSTTPFTVTATNSCGPVTDIVIVTVNLLPAANAGADVTLCAGDFCTLTASGGTTYLWNPSTGLDDAASATPFASPDVTTPYTVTATDGNGCEGTDVVIVTIDSCNGVHESSIGKGIFIFPNPSVDGKFLVSGSWFRVEGIQIYNLLGERVFNQQQVTSNEQQVSIDLSNLPKGIYFLKLQTDRKTFVRKIILE